MKRLIYQKPVMEEINIELMAVIATSPGSNGYAPQTSDRISDDDASSGGLFGGGKGLFSN